MKPHPIADYLRNHEHVTVDQYQHILNITQHYKANQYLLQLVRSEHMAYLQGLKDALIATGQKELVQYLPLQD